MDRKPLVIEDGQVEQLQAPDDLDIPLVDRVVLLERQVRLLSRALLEFGVELPPDLITLATEDL